MGTHRFSTRFLSYLPVVLSLAVLSFGASHHPAGVTDPGDEPSDFQLRLIEEFHAVGAEPTFWAVMVKSDMDRSREQDGRVGFSFQMTELEAVIGGEDPLRFLPSGGVERMVLRQDPTTQQVFLDSEATTQEFLNGMLSALGSRNRGQGWTETLRLFDGSIVPGLESLSVEVSFEVEPLPIGRGMFTLMRFESQPVSFVAEGSRADVRYRGLVLVDEGKELVYHMVFQQSGAIASTSGETQLSHVYLLSLLDRGDQPVVPLRGVLLDLVNEYVLSPRPDGVLNPAVLELNPRPAWATGVWLSGRIGSAVMGMVAEQSTNPAPIASIGSLVLSDQAIGFAGNLYVDEIHVREGLLDESQRNAADKDFLSPLERVYAADPANEDRDSERAALFGPETTGVAVIGDREILIGITAGAAALLLTQSGSSALGFTTGGAAVPAGGVGVGAGVVAVGAGVAVADSGSSGGGGQPGPAGTLSLDFVETPDTEGLFTGTVTATLTEGTPGDMLTLTGTGTVTGGSVSNWNQTASAVVDANNQAMVQIPLITHECIDGSLAVTINGTHATVSFMGSTFQSPFSDPCF